MHECLGNGFVFFSLGMCSKQISKAVAQRFAYICAALLSVSHHSSDGSPSIGKAPRSLPGTDTAIEECFIPLFLQLLVMLVGFVSSQV